MKTLLTLLLTLSICSGRDLIINILNPTTDTPREAFLVQDRFVTPVDIPKRNFSPKVTIPAGDLSLSLVAKLPPKGEPIPSNAPKIQIPADWQAVIVILLADDSNDIFPVRPLVLNADRSGFSDGKILACNFSKTPIISHLEDRSTNVYPGKFSILNPPKGEGTYGVTIERLIENKPLPLFSGKWRSYSDRKQILFITPSNRPGKPRVKSLMLPL